MASIDTRAVTVVRHPLAEHALSILRDRNTQTDAFRRYARVLAQLLALQVLEELPTREAQIETPIETTTGRLLDGTLIFVPVLRAGLALLDAISDFVPGSKVGFVGLERDEQTAIARSYYQKLPQQLEESTVIILDPMLATGGSAVATIKLLREHAAREIRLACVVAAPEGIALVAEQYPDVRIYSTVVDRTLNDKKFIVPGLGDFGDRYFGTV